MCGIAGIYNLDKRNVSQKVLHAMDFSLRHRGPDGHGELIDNFIGFANRRLAIIDPTPDGDQPLSTPDKNFSITFNGEIFNYQRLRQKLLKQGVNFKTQTDTEVVLYSYILYGENCIQEFIGQFAFAIWDRKKERIFLARDHLGINPLFYSVASKTFLFASEIKAILASHLVKKELNKQAFYHYLSVFSIPQPLTIFSSISSLLPGYYLTIDKNGINQKKYWSIPDENSNKFSSYIDAKSELKKLLLESVKSAMVSDVPVGAFLSGGIDSSTIVALMSKNSSKKIKTYSLYAEGYGEAFDERKYASILSRKYKTEHCEFNLKDKDLLQDFNNFIYYLDQPNGESLETYFLSKEIGKDVKVALSGLGGDELFAGYHQSIYKSLILTKLYNLFPKSLISTFIKLIEVGPFSQNFKKTAEVSDIYLKISNPLQKRLFLYFAYQDSEKKDLITPEFISKINFQNTSELLLNKIKNKQHLKSLVDKLQYLDLNSYTRDNLLLTANTASMAHSLEVRIPFLDRRLVDYSFSIPDKFKLSKGKSKYILKDVVKDLLPTEILNHKKQGFGLPRIKYMRGILKAQILDALDKASVKKRGILNPEEVNRLVNGFYSAKSSKMLWTEHLRIWTLFVFELWARRYLD